MIDQTLAIELFNNAMNEVKYAKNIGNLAPDSTPMARVVLDGTWGKRSHRGGKHDSLGGTIAIISFYTQKVLDIVIKNKYCIIGTKAENCNKPVPKHKCHKNWDRTQSSTSMEAQGVLEAFQRSYEMYGLIYHEFISDDDASTYHRLVEANPYARFMITPKRIKCKNHLHRNVGRKLNVASGAAVNKKLCSSKKGDIMIMRQKVKSSGIKIRRMVDLNVLRLRKRIDESLLLPQAQQNSIFDEQVEALRQTMQFIPNHIFHDHTNCPEDWDSDDTKENLVPRLTELGFYEAITKIVTDLSKDAEDLMYNVTSNIVEQFFSIVAQFISGKRVNYCARDVYQMRVHFAALQQTSSGAALRKIYEHLLLDVPYTIEKLEMARREQLIRNTKSRQRGKKRRRVYNHTGTDKDYGPAAMQPDLDVTNYSLYVRLEDEQKLKLQSRTKDWIFIEENTRDELLYGEFHEFEKDMIPSHLFGTICHMHDTTSSASVIRKIRQPISLDAKTLTIMGKYREQALGRLSEELGYRINPCGIFVSSEDDSFFCCARPDGVIDKDMIVILICFFEEDKNISVQIAKQQKSNLKVLKSFMNRGYLTKGNVWYYIVQGQLHITGREFCFFATVTQQTMKISLIERDDTFWLKVMKPKLERFYLQALLPEIIDSRIDENLPIREPQFTINARKKIKTPVSVDHTDINVHNSISKVSNRETEISLSDECNAEPVSSYQQNERNTMDHVRCGEKVRDVVANYDAMVLNLTEQNLKSEILPSDKLLEDTIIYAFIRIVSSSSYYRTISPIFFQHLNLLLPSKSKNDIQIIGGRETNQHWICVHVNWHGIFIDDSLNRRNLDPYERLYTSKRYPNQVKLGEISQPNVTQQPDGYSCEVYAAAYATSIVFGDDPSDVLYSRNITEMRRHLLQILLSGRLARFPVDTSAC